MRPCKSWNRLTNCLVICARNAEKAACALALMQCASAQILPRLGERGNYMLVEVERLCGLLLWRIVWHAQSCLRGGGEGQRFFVG